MIDLPGIPRQYTPDELARIVREHQALRMFAKDVAYARDDYRHQPEMVSAKVGLCVSRLRREAPGVPLP